MSSSDYYELCINALRNSKSDNEKLCALLIVSKYLKPSELSKDQIRKIFAKVGIPFVLRLLISNENDGLVSLGVNLVSSYIYCDSHQIDLLVLIRIFTSLSNLLSSEKWNSSSNTNDDYALLSDILFSYEIMISNDDRALNVLGRSGSITSLIAFYENLNASKTYKENVFNLILKIAYFDGFDTIDEKLSNSVMLVLAKRLYEDHSQLKFEICSHLANILTSKKVLIKKVSWLPYISNALKDIFCSQLNTTLRSPSFRLAASLTEISNGFDWILSSNEKLKSPIVLYSILTRLACIEISLQLELPTPDPEIFGSCLILLEHFIISLIKPDCLLDKINPQFKISSLDTLRSTINCVNNFLKIASQKDDFFISSDCTISIGAIRILCLWITEAPELIEDEVNSLVPFLVSSFKSRFNKLVGNCILSALRSLAEINDRVKEILDNEDILKIVYDFDSNLQERQLCISSQILE